METWQIVLIIISSIVLFSFLISLVSVRGNLVALQEKVRKCKSDLRVAKSRYLQVLNMTKKTNKDVNREAQLDDDSYSSLIGQPNQYKSLEISALSVNELSINYERVQRDLNYAINRYNVYRRKLHVIPIALLLGYKKEKYIDEDRLELINTQGYDENEI